MDIIALAAASRAAFEAGDFDTAATHYRAAHEIDNRVVQMYDGELRYGTGTIDSRTGAEITAPIA